jgi:glycolate dehydrogenase FAD-binding subunit
VTATLMNPTNLKGVRDAVLDSAGSLGIVGAGTAAGWAGALRPVDAVLDLRGLTGVITHNPGDMTVSVRAGTPLRELNAELAEHGQHVAFDAARMADGATVGGLLATGDAGPAALVHGSLRDLVIGVTLVLADGTVARSGGHVIKNVAGFDLAKLVHGSYGTLAVVAEVVLRLHPLPHAATTLVLPCTLAEAAEHAAAVLGGPYEPAALEWVSDPGALLVRIEGTAAALPARVEQLRELLGPRAVPVDAGGSDSASDERPGRPNHSDEGAARRSPDGAGARNPAETDAPDLAAASGASGASGAAAPGVPVDVDEAARLAFSRRERSSGGASRDQRLSDEGAVRRNLSDESAVRRDPAAAAERPSTGSPPGADRADPWAGHARLTRGTLDDAVLRIGVRPSRLAGVLAGMTAQSITAGLGTGVATVALPADPAVVAAAHAAVHAAAGTSVLRNRPLGFDGSAWGPPPSALAVLRAVKQELDPAGRLGPGRLAPWLNERTR